MEESRENTGNVGYGNPPLETRFKPGESGNPTGRPKGSKNRSTVFNKWLSIPAKVENPETKQEEEGTIEDKIAVKLIGAAMDGDIQAAKEVLDSAYGKAVQPTDLTTGGDKIDLSGYSAEEKKLLYSLLMKSDVPR